MPIETHICDNCAYVVKEFVSQTETERTCTALPIWVPVKARHYCSLFTIPTEEIGR